MMKSFPPNGGERYQLQGLHNISSRWWALWGQTCDFTYYKYTWLDFLQLSPMCHFVLPFCKHGALRENTSLHPIIQMLFVSFFSWAFYDISIKGHLQMPPAFCTFFFSKLQIHPSSYIVIIAFSVTLGASSSVNTLNSYHRTLFKWHSECSLDSHRLQACSALA